MELGSEVGAKIFLEDAGAEGSVDESGPCEDVCSLTAFSDGFEVLDILNVSCRIPFDPNLECLT